MKNLFYWLTVLFLFFIIVTGLAVYFYRGQKPKPIEYHHLTVGGTSLIVEYAITPEEWAKGLGGRSALKEDRGMLFVSDKLILPGFWMKGMRFPIDIIWIRDHEVIGITQNVPVASEPTELVTYYPPNAVTKVLEVNAGWAQRNDIKEGDLVEIRD